MIFFFPNLRASTCRYRQRCRPIRHPLDRLDGGGCSPLVANDLLMCLIGVADLFLSTPRLPAPCTAAHSPAVPAVGVPAARKHVAAVLTQWLRFHSIIARKLNIEINKKTWNGNAQNFEKPFKYG